MSRIRIAALLAVIALIPAAAEAQSTITACYVPKTGSVYRIQAPGAPEACKSSHVEFSWQTGAPSGLAGYQIRGSALTEIGGNSTYSVNSACQSGEVAVGGGYGFNPAISGVSVTSSGPLVNGTGWTASIANFTATPVFVYVWAVCVQAAS